MSKDMRDDEDFLTEDAEISSQKVVLLSFLSPEKILKNKDVYFFQQFLKDYNLQWRTSKFEGWLAEQVAGVNNRLETLAGNLEKKDLSGATVSDLAKDIRGNLLRVDRLVEEFQQYTRKYARELTESALQEEFDTYVFKNGAKLEEEFFKKNDFHTTIRGIKVRGVYSSEAEASARAKRLQKNDPNFNIYMGAVGKWMAWEPDPNKVGDQEYANEQLNTLMKKYRENEESRDQFYTEQKNRRVGTSKTMNTTDTTIRPSEDAGAGAAGPVAAGAGAGAGAYDGMFSEPADLAISRKMEKAEAEAADAKAEAADANKENKE